MSRVRLNKGVDWNGAQHDRPFGLSYNGRAYADGWDRTFGNAPEPEPTTMTAGALAQILLRNEDAPVLVYAGKGWQPIHDTFLDEDGNLCLVGEKK